MTDTDTLGRGRARLLVCTLTVAIGCSGGGKAAGGDTGGGPDLTGPTVVAILPGASGVPVGATLSVVFSELLDLASVDGTSVKIDGVDAALTSRCSGLFLSPASDLEFDATYALSISGLRDLAGNAMQAPYLHEFRTAAPALASAIAADEVDTYALRDDGSVFGWGLMFLENGRPGAGLLIGGPPAYGSVWSGGRLTLGSGGTVWTLSYSQAPSQVPGLADVTAAESGAGHFVARRSDGTAWAWGANGYGQIGDGSTSDRLTPVQVGGLGNVVAVAAGGNHTLALKGDGTVGAWGYNSHGQLGDGTLDQRTTPVAVTGLANVTAIAAGNAFSLALRADGTVWRWGAGSIWAGSYWQWSGTPVEVPGLPPGDVVAITAGGFHAMALAQDGTVWTWGDNTWGQLGNGHSGRTTSTVAVGGLPSVVAVAGGQMHSVALASDGAIWTWGGNEWGQLGDGTALQRNSPAQAIQSTTVLSVPRVPFGTQATARDRGMQISWLPVPGATSYDIYIRASSTVSPATGTRVQCATSPHVIAGLPPAVLHSACVVASNASGDGLCSNVVTATPTGSTPPGGGSCTTVQHCGVVTDGVEWMGAWYLGTCPCPPGLVQEGGGYANSLCGLPGDGYGCKFCGCPQ